ncbi:MAG: RrF2 family transcriptional regulator, partial [Clostridium sp.]
MYLSKFTDYSFRALIYLAVNREKLCTVEELAQNLDVSEHHLKKVIHKLAKTEYITSIKGRSGGLKLGLEPKDINLGEVLKITEDNLNIAECFNKENTCPFITG